MMRLMCVGAAALLLGACSSAGPFDSVVMSADRTGSTAVTHGIRYVVTTTYDDTASRAAPLYRPMLRTRVVLHNDRTDSASVGYGACAVSLDAYRTPDLDAVPVWTSGRSEPWEGSFGTGCILIAYTRTLGPGDSVVLGTQARLIDLMGDSLPDGHYYLRAWVSAGFPKLGVATMRVPAGDFDLQLARAPLPDTATYNLMVFRRSTTASATDVRVTATATVTYAGGMLADFSRDCPLEIVAYRDKARRDAAPRSGAPDWRAPKTCGTAVDTRSLNRGESATFSATATARDILGTSLPDGRYYFAAVVRAPARMVWLSAGEADLRR